MLVALPDRPDLTPRQKPSTPQAMILGDWHLEKLEFSGRAGDNPAGLTRVFRISETETLFIMNGQPSPADGLTATYKIDWSANPIAIDLMPKQRGGVMPGILRLEGDRMIVALNTDGGKINDVGAGNRPTDFKNAPMTGYYRRVNSK